MISTNWVAAGELICFVVQILLFFSSRKKPSPIPQLNALLAFSFLLDSCTRYFHYTQLGSIPLLGILLFVCTKSLISYIDERSINSSLMFFKRYGFIVRLGVTLMSTVFCFFLLSAMNSVRLPSKQISQTSIKDKSITPIAVVVHKKDTLPEIKFSSITNDSILVSSKDIQHIKKTMSAILRSQKMPITNKYYVITSSHHKDDEKPVIAKVFYVHDSSLVASIKIK